MCGRYYSLFDKQQVAEHFHVRRVADSVGIIAPNWNVAPGDPQPVIRRSHDTGERELIMMRWGIVPWFAKAEDEFKALIFVVYWLQRTRRASDLRFTPWVMQIPAGILLGAYPTLSKPTYNKPALTFEEQLDQKLIPRGLIVEDRERALRWLRRVGYYRISGYLYPYRVSPVDDNFRPGASFDTAVSVYKFDSQLRLLLLQAIDRIEVAMRTSVTYHLSHALGPFGHMDQIHFKPYVSATTTSEAVGLNFAEFKRKAKSDERQSSEEFVGHYRSKYDNQELPIWMLTEVISFGTLSRITENLQDKQIQRKIARDLTLSQTQLISWMRCLCYIRNLCAHHSRIWNRPISVKPGTAS